MEGLGRCLEQEDESLKSEIEDLVAQRRTAQSDTEDCGHTDDKTTKKKKKKES